MDVQQILANIIAQSPVVGLLFWFLNKERERADRWERTYIEDAKATIGTLVTVSAALSEIKQELRK